MENEDFITEKRAMAMMHRWMRVLVDGMIDAIPLVCLLVMYVYRTPLYIPQLHIELPAGIIFLVGLLATILWEVNASMRRDCQSGGVFSILHGIVPFQIYLMLIFAAWHWKIAVALVALWAVVCLWFLVCIGMENLNYTDPENEEEKAEFRKKIRMNRRIAHRFPCMASAVLWAVPAFMALFVYDMEPPVWTAQDDSAVAYFKNAEADYLLEENQSLLDSLTEDKWAEYSFDQRLALMQEVAELEAARLGIPKSPVLCEYIDRGTLGEYYGEDKHITINRSHLEEDPAWDCVRTICHETYHSMQHFLVEGLDWSSPVVESTFFQDIWNWKENYKDYQNAVVDGYDAYAQQPVEADAFAYGEKEVRLLLGEPPAGVHEQ